MKHIKSSRRTVLFGAIATCFAISFAGASNAAPDPQKNGEKVKTPAVKETATLAAGCFWSMEAIFKQLKGVEKVEPGYSGGKVVKPSYEEVETGETGHAESLNITYDPKTISFKDLLEVMMTVRNPTTLDKQGNDVGTEYRSVIFYRNEDQRKAAVETIKKINDSKIWKAPVVTTVQAYSAFYRAEDYHFDYYRLHPNQSYCKFVIAPEIEEFRKKFKSKLKK